MNENLTITLQKEVPSRWSDTKGYAFGSAHNIQVTNADEPVIPESIKPMEYGYLYLLAKRMHSGTNLIRTGRRDQNPMSVPKMAEYLRLSEETTRKFLRKTLRLGIIARLRVVCGRKVQDRYYMNPLYFLKGKWLTPTVYWIFKGSLDKVLPAWVREKFEEQDAESRPQKICLSGGQTTELVYRMEETKEGEVENAQKME